MKHTNQLISWRLLGMPETDLIELNQYNQPIYTSDHMHVFSISIISFFRIVVCQDFLSLIYYVNEVGLILLCVYTDLCLLVTSFFLILLARFSYSLTESKRLINIQCLHYIKEVVIKDRLHQANSFNLHSHERVPIGKECRVLLLQ